MPFALLQVAESQLGELMATESTGQREGKQRPITFALQALTVGCLPEYMRLLAGQPVAEPPRKGFAATRTRTSPVTASFISCTLKPSHWNEQEGAAWNVFLGFSSPRLNTFMLIALFGTAIPCAADSTYHHTL